MRESVGMLISVIFPLVVTIAVTAFICWYRTGRSKSISYGTALIGAMSFPVTVTAYELMDQEFLSHKDFPILAIVLVLCLVTALCFLPALGVVVYYQKKNNL